MKKIKEKTKTAYLKVDNFTLYMTYAKQKPVRILSNGKVSCKVYEN